MSQEQETHGSDSAVVHLTEQTYDELLAAADGVWMVDFWAPWCRPCLAIAPVLEEMARASKGGVTLAKVNVDDHADRAPRIGDLRHIERGTDGQSPPGGQLAERRATTGRFERPRAVPDIGLRHVPCGGGS